MVILCKIVLHPCLRVSGLAQRLSICQATASNHLKWTPAIAFGYGASIAAHFWLNAAYF